MHSPNHRGPRLVAVDQGVAGGPEKGDQRPLQCAPGTAYPAEVLLDGHRYLIVPIEDGAPTPAAIPRPRPDRADASHLTARELQIASLVAEGLVNKQIAAELSISEWTVSTHLRRIFAKLGVDTRAAMVRRCAAVLAARDDD